MKQRKIPKKEDHRMKKFGAALLTSMALAGCQAEKQWGVCHVPYEEPADSDAGVNPMVSLPCNTPAEREIYIYQKASFRVPSGDYEFTIDDFNNDSEPSRVEVSISGIGRYYNDSITVSSDAPATFDLRSDQFRIRLRGGEWEQVEASGLDTEYTDCYNAKLQMSFELVCQEE